MLGVLSPNWRAGNHDIRHRELTDLVGEMSEPQPFASEQTRATREHERDESEGAHMPPNRIHPKGVAIGLGLHASTLIRILASEQGRVLASHGGRKGASRTQREALEEIGQQMAGRTFNSESTCHRSPSAL